MSRYTSQAAVEAIGNRYDLVLAASQRARELKNGSMPKVDGKDASFNVTALREIEQGKYTFQDYLNKLHTKKKGRRDEFDIT
jgi:DNA-directed RNA polymerase subunit omega